MAAFATVLVAVTVVGLGWFGYPRSQPANLPGPAAQAQRNLTRLTFDSGLQMDPTFPPDGRFIAYASDKAGNMDLWVQPIAGGDAVQITRSPAHDRQPSWSPDGSSIVFRSERDGGGLYLVPALGGQERRLADFGLHPSWSPNGEQVRFLTDDFERARLYTIPKTGGTPLQVLPEFTEKGRWQWIDFRPDGRVSFVGGHAETGYGFFTVSEAGAVVASDITGLPEALNDMVHNGYQRFRWNDAGTSLLFETAANNGVQNLWKITIDPVTLAWTSVERLTTGPGADVTASRSPDGRHLAFSTQRISERLWRFALDPVKRTVSDGQPFTAEYATALAFDVTPDARIAAFMPGRPGSYDMNLWTVQLGSGQPELLVESAAFPRWSPDGRQVAYVRIRGETIDHSTGTSEGIIGVRTQGGAERQVTAWTRDHYMPWDWTRDGRSILASRGPKLALWTVGDRPATTPAQVVLAGNNWDYGQARFSPDGRWLAVVGSSPATPGGPSLFVTAAQGPANRALTPAAPPHVGVDRPRWAPDGRRVYFLSKQKDRFVDIWAVDFDPTRGIPVGEPFRVTHFDSLDFLVSGFGGFANMEVRDRWLFVTMRSTSGSLWMLDNVDR